MAKYCTLDIGDAFRELLDHIDGLKFANGVLDSAAKDAQAWQHEAQTAKEAYCELLEANRVTEEAGGVIAQLNGMIDELRGVIAQLNGMIDELRAQLEAQRGGAVVVPDLTTEEAKGLVQGAIFNAIASREDGCWDWCDMIIHGYKLAVSRIQPIPASQVLQPGEVGVDRDYLADLEEAVIDTVEELERGFVLCENCGEQEETKTLDVMSMHLVPMKARIDALRSQAGGKG